MPHRYDPSSDEAPEGGAGSKKDRPSILRGSITVLVYVALYLALHFFSMAFQVKPAKISPFYPAHGASLALLLLFGLRYAPALLLPTMIIGLLNRQEDDPAWFLFTVSLLPAIGYSLAAFVLKRVLRIDPRLVHLRDVNWFALVSVLAPGVVASLAGLGFALRDRIAWPRYGSFVAMWWFGDATGIVTLTPFLLVVVAPWARKVFGRAAGRRTARRALPPYVRWSGLEIIAQAASIVISLWLVFGWHRSGEPPLYYVCFLPLIWIALRHELLGACAATLAINLGVLLAVRGLELDVQRLAHMLLFLEVLSLTGLVLGAVVHERKQAERAVRQGEERYRAFVQQSTEGIACFDNERSVPIDLTEDEQIRLLLRYGYLVECNDVQARMYGFQSAKEMVGFRLTDSSDRSDPANVVNLRAFIRSGYRLSDVESVEFDRDGNTKYFLNNAVGIVENGALVRMWCTQREITERKKAEEALRASEERFSIAFNASPLPMTISTVKEGRIVDVNAAYLRASGFTREEIFGHTSISLGIWPEPEDRLRFLDLLKGEGAIRNVEMNFRNRKGDLRIMLLSAELINLDGEECALVVVNDITRRKRGEEALRRSEMSLASAQQLAHIGNWELDLLTGSLFWSDETYRILGLDPAVPATEEMFWNAIHPDDRAPLRRLISQTLLKGKLYSVDHRIVLPDGSQRVVHSQGEAILDDNRMVVRLIGTAQDITERKQMENALVESEARFRHVFESNMIGIGYSGEGGVITDANDALLNILGYGRREVLERQVKLPEITPAGYQERDQRASAELESTGAFTPYEKEFIRKDGRRVPVLIGGAMLVGFQDRGVFFVLDITERKLAEEVLRDSEQLHRTLFERNLAGVYRSTLDGRILGCNDSLARILGYQSAEEIVSRPAGDLYFDRADRGKFVEQLSEHGALTDLEWCMKRKDGSPVWIIENTSLIREADGNQICIQGTLIDITERKRAEEALRESEAIFRTLTETIPAGIFIYRGEQFIYANPAGQTITGYSLDELLQMNMLDTVHPEHREMVRGYARARQQGTPAPSKYELKLLSKSGEEKWADMTAAVLNHQGRPAVMITVFDITKRKQAEEALRTAEEKYRSIFENASEGIYQSTPSGQFITANPALARILGYQSAEELIENLTDFHNGQYVEPGRRGEFRRLLEEQTALSGFENQSHRKDGAKIWISENARAVRDESGALLYYEGTMEDVTNRKRAEQRQAAQFAVTRVLAESAALEEAIPKLLQSLCREVEWEVGLFWLADPESKLLKLETTGHGPFVDEPSMEEIDTMAALSKGESLAGRVWLEREAVWSSDLLSDVTLRGDGPGKKAGLRGAFGFPIPVTGDVFAVMQFLSPDVRPRDEDLLKMMADIGSQIGQFIERKRAEDEQARLQSAISNAAAEWQLTFDAIESPVLVLDLDGRVRRMNRAAQMLSGGSEPGQLLQGQPWQRIAESVGIVRTSRAPLSSQIVDDSNGKSWDIVVSPFLAPGERDQWVIAVARDISGMVELQESLRRSETMSAMGSLVAGVAHEVRNPLFGISATLDAFDARFGMREDFQQYTKVLRGEVDRLSRLMQDLLDFGKPASLNLYAGDLDSVITEAVQTCNPMASRSQVQIVTGIQPDLPLVRMDQRRLVQVFQNLLENAVHHSPAGGVVTVSAEETVIDQRIWIECLIKDDGRGFLIEDLPRIFEPFFTRRRGGTGLGLSIVQRIMEEHGGQVTAANRNGGGGIIVVRFPAEPD